jgi:hypothetical protein
MRNIHEVPTAPLFLQFSNEMLPQEPAAGFGVPRVRSGTFAPLTVGPRMTPPAANTGIEAAPAGTPANAELATHLADGAEYFFVSYAREESSHEDTDFGITDDDEVGWF